ncbi:hypothetical protein YB2330_006302 [Saitoella coloradoensis]
MSDLKSPDYMNGSCFCGVIKWKADVSKITLSAYCHCTFCQRTTGGPYVHTTHHPSSSISFTGLEHAHSSEWKPRKHKKRCGECGAPFASYSQDRDNWSVWSSGWERDGDGMILGYEKIRPTCHQFAGTMQMGKNELGELPVYEGYEGKSKRLDQDL